MRNPGKLGEIKDKVEFVHGDMFDASSIDEIIKDTEAVLSTIAPSVKNPGNPELYKRAMTELVYPMKKHGIKRLIHIGGAVHSGGENEKWTISRKLLRFFLKLISNPILVAKHMEGEVLKTSGLDWTLISPPGIIKGKATGKLIVNDKNLYC